MKKILLIMLLIFFSLMNSFSFTKIWEKQYPGYVHYFKFSHDGKELFLYSNNDFCIINSADGILERKISLPDSINRLFISPDETKILCKLKDSIIIISLTDGTRINTFLSSFKYNNYSFVAISEDNNDFYEGGSSITGINWGTMSLTGYSRLILRSMIDGSIVKTIIDSTADYGIIQCFGFRYPDEYFFSSNWWINNDSFIVNKLFTFNSNQVSSYFSDTATNYFNSSCWTGIVFSILDDGAIITKYGTNDLYGDYNIITKDGMRLFIYSENNYTDFENYYYNNKWYVLYISDKRIYLGYMTNYIPPHYQTIDTTDTANYVDIVTSTNNKSFASRTSDGYITLWNPSKISSVFDENEKQFNIYPNPFSGTATISYQLREPSFVNLSITDIFGRDIYTIVENQLQDSGEHTCQWSMVNGQLESGLYFLKLQAGDRVEMEKILIIK